MYPENRVRFRILKSVYHSQRKYVRRRERALTDMRIQS